MLWETCRKCHCRFWPFIPESHSIYHLKIDLQIKSIAASINALNLNNIDAGPKSKYYRSIEFRSYGINANNYKGPQLRKRKPKP